MVCTQTTIFMKRLFEYSECAIESVNTDYIREFASHICSADRLIGIKGGRGVGKTTLLLQYLKNHKQRAKAIYVSLDDLYFSENKLCDFADDFVKNGGRFLFIDEAHHYNNWAQEIKLIYDRYPELRVVFTGSSILHLGKAKADLSRRAVIYNLPGLSLREFINIEEKQHFGIIGFEQLLKKHKEISVKICSKIKPIEKFNRYNEYGYFPFFIENKKTYLLKLNQVINLVLESDLPFVTEISTGNIDKLRQLLYIIASNVPFTPNVNKLSERLEAGRNTLKTFFYYLHQAQMVQLLYSNKKGMTLLTKPEKIYLYHPNHMHAITHDIGNVGTIRETFFINQVAAVCKVNYPEAGDFLVNGKFLFEVGGKNKTFAQIRNIPDSFLAIDGIEIGYKNEIPLWLFGFLY